MLILLTNIHELQKIFIITNTFSNNLTLYFFIIGINYSMLLTKFDLFQYKE